MMATLLEENTREDGAVHEEDEIRAAAVAMFLGMFANSNSSHNLSVIMLVSLLKAELIQYVHFR